MKTAIHIKEKTVAGVGGSYVLVKFESILVLTHFRYHEPYTVDLE